MAPLVKSSWFISIVGGLVVTLIVAAAGFVFGPLVKSAVPIIGANPSPSPKTTIEIRANSFEITGIYARSLNTFFIQLERELILTYLAENKMNETDAKREAMKFISSIYEIKTFQNIFEVAGASGYNRIFIENKGAADDKNVVLFIDGIRFVADIENHKNIEREKNLIKIKIIRPGDDIYLHVWTQEILFGAKSNRVRASSDAGVIAVSVH